jgi:hypothetical protein
VTLFRWFQFFLIAPRHQALVIRRPTFPIGSTITLIPTAPSAVTGIAALPCQSVVSNCSVGPPRLVLHFPGAGEALHEQSIELRHNQEVLQPTFHGVDALQLPRAIVTVV